MSTVGLEPSELQPDVNSPLSVSGSGPVSVTMDLQNAKYNTTETVFRYHTLDLEHQQTPLTTL